MQSAIGNPQLTTAIDFLACTIFWVPRVESSTRCFWLFGLVSWLIVESRLSGLHWPLAIVVGSGICGMHSRISRLGTAELPTHAQPLAGFHFVSLKTHWLSQSASASASESVSLSVSFYIYVYVYISVRVYLMDPRAEPTRARRAE